MMMRMKKRTFITRITALIMAVLLSVGMFPNTMVRAEQPDVFDSYSDSNDLLEYYEVKPLTLLADNEEEPVVHYDDIALLSEQEDITVNSESELYKYLSKKMAEIADNNTAELILTTGGTGFSPRDIMPEATEDIIDRRVPGIPEAMRAYSMTITKRAMLSRATAGIRKKTLIVNLPGSPKAVKESLEYIIDTLAHGLEILSGEARDCARK